MIVQSRPTIPSTIKRTGENGDAVLFSPASRRHPSQEPASLVSDESDLGARRGVGSWDALTYRGYSWLGAIHNY